MHRVLVIGGGSIGERHVRCFLETDRAEVSLCESRGDRLTELSERYPLAQKHESFDRVDLSNFDAAVVAVSADLHVPFARTLVQAGVNVLLEKPLSVSREGVEELETEVEEHNATVAVGYIRRAMPRYRLLKKEVAGGRIGNVLSVLAVIGYDHRLARPDYRHTYFARRETGGGAIHDMMSHIADLLHWLIGPVETVTADYDHMLIEDADVEDTAILHLRFKDRKTLACVTTTMWQAYREETLKVHGTQGSIVCERAPERVGVVLNGRDEWDWREFPSDQTDARAQADPPYIFQAERFLDAIEGKGKVLCSLGDARHALDVCLAAHESRRRRCAVEIA